MNIFDVKCAMRTYKLNYNEQLKIQLNVANQTVFNVRRVFRHLNYPIMDRFRFGFFYKC